MIRFRKNLSAGRAFYQFWGNTSNCYLLVDFKKDASYLIDCGMPSDTGSLLNVLKKLPSLTRVVCTHFHVDHISGWNGLKKTYRKAEIWFHKKARPFVSGDKSIPFPGFRAFKEILIPCMLAYAYLPRPGDVFRGMLLGTPFKKGFPEDRLRYFADTEEVLPGFISLPTPGHRPDETSFLDPESGIFISGDFIVVLNGEALLNSFVSNHEDQKASLKKIKQLHEISVICPGHGRCVPFSPHAL
jgi:glyoxylase-like metal-dependent hydrolase (beta-lactamase superfamily II)